MPESENKIQIANFGHIDWNNLWSAVLTLK